MDISNCSILLLILVQRIWATYFEYHITDWLTCETVDNQVFTRLNITLPECVETCARRSRCRAVSYNRQKKKCELLAEEQNNEVQSTLETSCVYIKRMDMIIPKEIAYECEACSINQTCGKDNFSCIFTECLPLEVANATVVGNMINVGSGIKIVPDPGYILSTNQSKSKCQENGTWSNVPTSIFPDCGDPPTISNATHSGSNTSLGGQIDYACVDGYHVVNDSTVNMTIKCRLNFSSTPIPINWSPVMFQCIEDPCPPGWIERNQSCYMFSYEWLSHDNATEYCDDLGAHLVTIESQEENDFLKEYMYIFDNYGTWWWIGIDDKENEGDWVYTHTKEHITFRDWANGQPSSMNPHENCVCMYSVFGWHDVPCDWYIRPICEKAAVVQQQ